MEVTGLRFNASPDRDVTLGVPSLGLCTVAIGPLGVALTLSLEMGGRPPPPLEAGFSRMEDVECARVGGLSGGRMSSSTIGIGSGPPTVPRSVAIGATAMAPCRATSTPAAVRRDS